jgi:HlyD family secretion protein
VYSRLLNQPAFALRHSRLIEDHRNLDQEQTEGGQSATVRSDAFPDKMLKGHVKSVATVASQQDWMSTDVRVYQTMISIDEPLEGLKPGMSAEVIITTDAMDEAVLAVPIQAVLGSGEMGRKRRVYVMTARGPELREVTVGMSNDKMAEITEGLQEGEEVVVNPRVLLTDKEKAQFGEAVTPKAKGGNEGKAGFGEGGKGEKGKAKGEKGKGGKGWPGKGGPGGPPVEPAN